MIALAAVVPIEAEPAVTPLRHPWALPLFLAVAILLAPLVWLGLVVALAVDSDKEAYHVA